MNSKYGHLSTWRSRSRRSDESEFVDRLNGLPVTIVCSPQRARAILTAPQHAVIKGEFQKSPFYSLLGANWLAYFDGQPHIERRCELLRLLRKTRERMDWLAYQNELVFILRHMLATTGVPDLFETLATFSSYQLGRALFGESYTSELNGRVRVVWEAMNDIAGQYLGCESGVLAEKLSAQAADLRASLDALLPVDPPVGDSRTALLDNLVGLLFASQDTSASAATTAVCLTGAAGLGGVDIRQLIVRALAACPPAPLIYRVIGQEMAVISPYVLRNDIREAQLSGDIVAASDQLLVFGAGTHRCPGDRIALSEIGAMLGAIQALPRAKVHPGEFPELNARIVLRPKGVVQIMTDSEDEDSGYAFSSLRPKLSNPRSGSVPS